MAISARPLEVNSQAPGSVMRLSQRARKQKIVRYSLRVFVLHIAQVVIIPTGRTIMATYIKMHFVDNTGKT